MLTIVVNQPFGETADVARWNLHCLSDLGHAGELLVVVASRQLRGRDVALSGLLRVQLRGIV